MAAIIKVKVTDTKLRKMRERFKPGSAAAQKMMRQWGILYLARMRQRFNKFSRGGGSWVRLSPATVKAKKGSRIILKDTGILFNAFSPGAPGNLLKLTPKTIQVGIGGSGRHTGRLTIAKLAEYHHTGKGRLPARPLIELPDRKTIEQMIAVGRKLLVEER